MTPSKGTLSCPTDTVRSLSRGGVAAVAEKAWFVEEFESTPLSALAQVRLRGGFVGFNLLGANLALRLEKSGGFGAANEEEDLSEHLLADRAPPGAWVSTSIFEFAYNKATASSTTLLLLLLLLILCVVCHSCSSTAEIFSYLLPFYYCYYYFNTQAFVFTIFFQLHLKKYILISLGWWCLRRFHLFASQITVCTMLLLSFFFFFFFSLSGELKKYIVVYQFVSVKGDTIEPSSRHFLSNFNVPLNGQFRIPNGCFIWA